MEGGFYSNPATDEANNIAERSKSYNPSNDPTFSRSTVPVEMSYIIPDTVLWNGKETLVIMHSLEGEPTAGRRGAVGVFVSRRLDIPPYSCS